MRPELLFLGQILTSAMASAIALRRLSPSLLAVLERLCPDVPAANFWLIYTQSMLVIAPLLVVLLTGLAPPFADAIAGLRVALIAALTGLLAALILVGRQIAVFIRRPAKAGVGK